MKKRILRIAGIVLLGASLTAASVWEGAAGIASIEEFPVPGHYVKSSAFPKNTIVEITNLENGVTVNAIVTDTAASAGVLAVLAPSTAGSLGISGGAITRIRVRIPDGLFDADDFSVNNNLMDPDINPAAALAMDRARYNPAAAEETAAPAVITARPSAITVPSLVDTTAVADLAEIGTPVPEETPATEPVQPEIIAGVPAPTSAFIDIADTATPAVPAEEMPAADSFTPGFIPAETAAITAEPEAVITEETPAADLFEPELVPTETAAISAEPEAVIAEETPAADSFNPEFAPAETAAIAAEPEAVVTEETPLSDSFSPEFAPAETAAIAAEPEAVVTEETPLSDLFEPELVPTETAAIPAEPEAVIAGETPEVGDVLVVLDPADPLPPAVSDEPELVIAIEPETAPVAAPVPAAPKEEPAVARIQPPATEPPAATDLPLVDTLDRSAYYIQIAVMSDKNGTKELVSKYSSYPLAVQELQRNGKTMYRILVGPIALDEYGAALERFKKLGFTDAFVASVRR